MKARKNKNKGSLKKDVVIGLGEIGAPIFKFISKSFPTMGYDINSQLINKHNLKLYENIPTELLHICIPYSKNFKKLIITYSKKFKPKGIVIHSTVSPYTTEKIQKKLAIPVIFSPTRGVHKRMIKDLKRYTKFFSIYDWGPNSKWASKNFVSKLRKAGIKTKKMSNPLVLEFAKVVVDTSYYGWLINYAQLSNIIAKQNNVDYDEMWLFSNEIHKYLGNRPKMFPGYIGGHCVIPNLDLIDNNALNLIKKINLDYAKTIKFKLKK